MFLTRLGYDSKAVITGDVTQVDLPDGKRSGLSDAIQLLGNVEGIGHCRFTDVDVVRHPLVQRIIRAYDSRDEQRRGDEESRERTGRRVQAARALPRDEGEELLCDEQE
jgi:phosphate starvation-inducible PhoH-like protein